MQTQLSLTSWVKRWKKANGKRKEFKKGFSLSQFKLIARELKKGDLISKNFRLFTEEQFNDLVENLKFLANKT